MAEEEFTGVGASDDDEVRPRRVKAEDPNMEGIPLEKWLQRAKAPLSQQVTYGSLGEHLVGLLKTLDSPLRDFVRKFCSTQPHPAAEPFAERKGDCPPNISWKPNAGYARGHGGELPLGQGHFVHPELLLLLWMGETDLCSNRPPSL